MRKWVLVFFFSFISTSCAVTYIDDKGYKRVVGFVNIALESNEEHKIAVGDRTAINNIGIMITSGPHCGGLGIGYTREEFMTLKNDALVVFPKKENKSRGEINHGQKYSY